MMSQSGPLHNPSEDWDKHLLKEVERSSKQKINKASCPYKEGAIYWCEECHGTGLAASPYSDEYIPMDDPCYFCSGIGWFLKSAFEILTDIEIPDEYPESVDIFLINAASQTIGKYKEEVREREKTPWEMD